MAVAPIDKVKDVIEYAVTQIPNDKIFMGIPNYGYDWKLPYIKGSMARSISNVEAINIGVEYGVEILFDETSKTPYFYYTDNEGSQHVVWFEDARSIQAKMYLIYQYGLRGASIWNIMRYFPQGYNVIDGLYNIEKVL